MTTSRTPLSIIALSALVILSPVDLYGQDARLESVASKTQWREIGPAIMGGRISDLAVSENNPALFFVGTATGGLWKTSNNGTTFEPVFDNQSTSSIGDVTISQRNPNLVWVGSGEPQNRQSSPWGNGVYRSVDGGRSWEHVGLEDTKHISRIQIHPIDNDIVFVAAMGHLWGPNQERGVFRTKDGGRTWEKVLYINEFTGIIDLIMDPSDPNTLFAAAYQRQRTGFGFNGGGLGSGIYRTTDGGATWKELTQGLPSGIKGRIGLDIYRGDPNFVFAVIEADLRGVSPEQRQNGVYRSSDRGDTWEHLSTTNNRPMYYSQIRVDPNDPDRIYLGGADLYVSKDGGRTFTNDAAEGVHLDHHALWIDPNNSNHLLLGSDGGVSTSWDRGTTWSQYRNIPLAQFYEIGVDMQEPYHVCGGLQDNGSWCAPSDTYTTLGIRNRDWYNVGSGDGFYNQIDPTDPMILYNESQGGNIQRVDRRTFERARIRPIARPDENGNEPDYRYNWNAPIVISSHDPATIYFGSNHVFKTTDRGQTWQTISPDLTRNIDRSNLEIMGVAESRMLSRHDGISTYGNLTTLSESPIDPGVLYAGSDDGHLQGTRDGGASWSNLTDRIPDLPERTYVSDVVASRFDIGTVYATFDGHRNDDYRTYVYISRDYGRNWQALTNGLPESSVNVLIEHPKNRRLLFLGNEVGLYLTIDQGQQWTRLGGNFPTVPVDDIVVHPRENDLVVGTHGRSAWIVDDITYLEEMSREVLAANSHLFTVRTATMRSVLRPQGWTPGVYEASNPERGAFIRYFLGQAMAPSEAVVTDGASNGGPTAANQLNAASDGLTLTIVDAQGNEVRTLEATGDMGLNHIAWDLRYDAPYEAEEGGFGGARGPLVLPGMYTARLRVNDETHSTTFEVRGDPRVSIPRADLLARHEALMSLHQLARPLYEADQALTRVTQQTGEAQRLFRRSAATADAVSAEITSIQEQLRSLRERLNDASGMARGAGAMEGSTSRPTGDQLWQVEEAWRLAPDVITDINTVIRDRMPALNRLLNEHGIRPDPGEPVTVPRRR